MILNYFFFFEDFLFLLSFFVLLDLFSLNIKSNTSLASLTGWKVSPFLTLSGISSKSLMFSCGIITCLINPSLFATYFYITELKLYYSILEIVQFLMVPFPYLSNKIQNVLLHIPQILNN